MSASAYVLIFESESLAGLSARNGAVSGFGHAGSANLLILTTVRGYKSNSSMTFTTWYAK